MWGYDYDTYRMRAERLREEARAAVLAEEAAAVARRARTARRHATRQRAVTGRGDVAPERPDAASPGWRDVASERPDAASWWRAAWAVRMLRRVRRMRAAQGVRG